MIHFYFQQVEDAVRARTQYAILAMLRCYKADKTVVELLWCEACRIPEDKITGMKNILHSMDFGSSNQKISDAVNHATSDRATPCCLGAGT